MNYQAHSETKEALFELSSFSEGEVWLRLAHIFVGTLARPTLGDLEWTADLGPVL